VNQIPRVLVVDDEVDVRESLREILEDEGYDVALAADGRRGLEGLRQNPPCAVILDIIMPVMSGVEMYAEMQKDPTLAGIPVIISTSDPSRAPSGVLIMKKPIHLPRLIAALDTYCKPKTDDAAS
jgi:two-component system, sensor histidine kinase and response regulator